MAISGRLGRTVLAIAVVAIAAVPAWAADEFPDVETGDAPWGLFGRSVWAKVWVAAPPRAVFATLTDYERFDQFMPLVERVDVLERGPKHAVLRFKMRYARWFDVEQTDRRVVHPYSRIDYVGVKGPLRSVTGDWRFAAERGGTRLTYRAQVDPGVPVPGVLMGALVKRGLPGLLDGVRRRTESGGTWVKRAFP